MEDQTQSTECHSRVHTTHGSWLTRLMVLTAAEGPDVASGEGLWMMFNIESGLRPIRLHRMADILDPASNQKPVFPDCMRIKQSSRTATEVGPERDSAALGAFMPMPRPGIPPVATMTERSILRRPAESSTPAQQCCSGPPTQQHQHRTCGK